MVRINCFRNMCAFLITVIFSVVLVGPAGAGETYYTTGTGNDGGTHLFAIEVSGGNVSTNDVVSMKAPGCASLAVSPSGTLYSVCGPLFGSQQLATVDQRTGAASLFGAPVSGLAVMAMVFGANGTLYAVGDCNPAPQTFECTPDSDPN